MRLAYWIFMTFFSIDIISRISNRKSNVILVRSPCPDQCARTLVRKSLWQTNRTWLLNNARSNNKYLTLFNTSLSLMIDALSVTGSTVIIFNIKYICRNVHEIRKGLERAIIGASKDSAGVSSAEGVFLHFFLRRSVTNRTKRQ